MLQSELAEALEKKWHRESARHRAYSEGHQRLQVAGPSKTMVVSIWRAPKETLIYYDPDDKGCETGSRISGASHMPPHAPPQEVTDTTGDPSPEP